MATKEDLKPRYAVTLDKAMESRIRQAVNNYANSIPHNPLTSLGDDISISTVSLRPMYTLKLDTQYESRWKAAFNHRLFAFCFQGFVGDVESRTHLVSVFGSISSG